MKNLDKAQSHLMFVSRYLNVEKVREVEEISTVTSVKLPAEGRC
ncbi:MAG: hypothetical protein JWN78_203 [Bacteroidota bacterium]|nr:hypothetical protein [Bacteroidota bacterium]